MLSGDCRVSATENHAFAASLGEAGGLVVRLRSVLAALIAVAANGASYGAAHGEELVYQPVNPSFGGNPFNSSHLMGLANTQNMHQPGSEARSSLDDFTRRIQSALLSRVSTEIANQILGEDAADSGSFVVDDTTISFTRTDGIVTVIITDGAGGSTEIRIPAPGG